MIEKRLKIGLIDTENQDHSSERFPNLALMKLSAWHKKQGDGVEWYEPLWSGHMDRVYIGKVFSFTQDYEYYVDADEVIKGGSGYCIRLENGKEVFDKKKDRELPEEIEHIMPDYSIYGITDTAYGFMSRGCPRGCEFCHVAEKEGERSRKVADLAEFWSGQRHIELMDPNTLACPEWKDILGQLEDSKAYVNFNQGVDVRLMTEEKIHQIMRIKTKIIHFAWDRYRDKQHVLPKLKMFKEITGWERKKVTVYVLCGYGSTMEENLERIEEIRKLDFSPYVMLYDKEHIEKGSELRKLQRWVNAKQIFWTCSFKEYRERMG